MNRLTTKVGLGIVFFISYCQISTNSSLAISLDFSDRYELTTLDEEVFFYREFAPNPVTLNTSLEIPTLDIQPEWQSFYYPNDFEELRTESTTSLVSISYQNIEELLPEPQINIEVRTNELESEDGNLLAYLTQSLENLQFSNFRTDSLSNPSVAILPQVAYGDIYRGLYDFQIDLSAPVSRSIISPNRTSPRVASRSLPQNLLISQEAIIDYSSRFSTNTPNTPSFATSPSGYNNYPSTYDNNASAQSPTSILGRPTPSNIGGIGGNRNNSVSYGRVAEELESVISENTNIFANGEEGEIQSEYEFATPSQQYQSQKDPMLQQLDHQRKQQERIREQRRRSLEMKLRQEQAQREQKRKMEARNITRQRKNRLRKQTQQQQQAFQKQRYSLQDRAQ